MDAQERAPARGKRAAGEARSGPGEPASRLSALIDASPVPILAYDRDGIVTLWSRAAERVFGWSEEEVLGRPLPIVPDDLRDEFQRIRDEVMQGRAFSNYETRRRRKDGSLIDVILSNAGVPGPTGAIEEIVALNQDITERLRAEEQVRASYEAALGAQQQAEALARRLADIQKVTDVALARTSLDDLLHGLLSHVNTALQADTTTIFLLDEEQRFERRASLGSDDELTNRVLNTVGQSVVHRNVERFEPILLDDASGFGDLVPDAKSIHSVAGVPLLVDARIIGVLCVGHAETGAFSRDDIRLLQLVADRAALAIVNARLYEHQRTVAETLQRSLIPKHLPRVPGAALAARYLAAGTGMEVGGDWYDAVELPGGRFGLAIGDVVGHGLDSAAGMGQIRSALRAYALDGHGPAGVLERLNRLVHALGEGSMTTLVYLVFDPAAGSVTFACAGHLPPLLVRAGGGATFMDGGEALPIGVVPDAAYAEAETTLEPGSTVVLYTDGLVERRYASLDDGLASLVAAAGEAAPSAEALVDRLLDALVGADGPDDDVALIALRLTATAPAHLELRLETDPAVLARLRRALGHFLEPAGVSQLEAYEITVACNEAAANAIEHPQHDGEAHFLVDVRRGGGDVEISVRDSGRWKPQADGNGFGLLLMEALMDSVEIRRGDDGTEVTMRRRLRTTAG